ncbi:MAG: hypothetical protein R3C39_15640 [Dehalococcoidia bacterium]
MTSNEQPDTEASRAEAPTAADLLRHALVDDEDPRFPWWLPLPGLALALGWAAFRAVTAGTPGAIDQPDTLEVLLTTLLWPGAAIFLLTSLAAFFGWQLEID